MSIISWHKKSSYGSCFNSTIEGCFFLLSVFTGPVHYAVSGVLLYLVKNDEKQIRYYVAKMMSWAYISHALWSLLVLALTPLILLCFNKLDAGTVQLAWYLILIHVGIGILMWPGSFVFPGMLRSMNDVKVVMFISIASMFAVRVGSSYLIARWINSGVLAVWIAMILDWAVRIIGFYSRYRSGAWKAKARCKARS